MKKLRKNLLALLIGLVVAIALAEVALHFIPLPLTDFNSTFAYQADSSFGYLPAPGQQAAFNFPCVRNSRVSTNALGFRGADWDTTRHPRIAVMGDSYLLGLTVPDELHLAPRMEQLSGGMVMNTGVSGFGTYHELLMWRQVLAPRRPDVAVLFVFLRNDVRDNHCGLTSPEGKWFSPCCEWKGNRIQPKMDFILPPAAPSGAKAWLKRNCRLCKVWANRNRKPRTERIEGADPFEAEHMAYQVFRPGAGPQWQEAWSITEELLRQMKDETSRAGVPLLVVTIPDPINLDQRWQETVKSELGVNSLPADFDPDFPRRRFQVMADSLGLEVLHLQDVMRQYRDKWALPSPEFGYACDGHWNPLGHRLAADAVYFHLAHKGWVNPRPEGMTQAHATHGTSPKEILGPEFYEQIYNGGTVSY